MASGNPDPNLISTNTAAGIAVNYASGSVTDHQGNISVIASIYKGDTSNGPLNLTGGSIIDPFNLGQTLTNPSAEIHVVIRDHGIAVSGDSITQIINYADSYCAMGEANVCRDAQAVLFGSSESGEKKFLNLSDRTILDKSSVTLNRNGDQVTAIISTKIVD